MNISLVKQKEIRNRIKDMIPEIIEARKLKKEIITIITTISRSDLSDSEKYLFENFPKITNSLTGSRYLKLDGNGFCSNPISKHCSYYGWSNEYNESEIFREIYLVGGDKVSDEFFENLLNNCPDLIKGDFSNILNYIKDDNEKQELIKKVSNFINYLRIAEKKLSRLNKIISSKEIGLLDIKEYSPKLYKIIKLVI